MNVSRFIWLLPLLLCLSLLGVSSDKQVKRRANRKRKLHLPHHRHLAIAFTDTDHGPAPMGRGHVVSRTALDRVRAIAQTSDGAMWFGTEAGLAKFDGRRTQTINDPALPVGRVLALQTDQDGALWVGTEGGAARFHAGAFLKVNETAGHCFRDRDAATGHGGDGDRAGPRV